MRYYTDTQIIERINILLLDALIWELDTFHTNADLLMADNIDKAYEFSDYLNPVVQPVRMRYLAQGCWIHSRIATRLVK